MEFGLWLFPSGPLSDLLTAIEVAEDNGVDEVWLGDEGPTGWDPFVVIALSIARTHKIRFGIAVTNPITRHPGVTANTCATLAEASNGRFAMLGFGAGGSLPLGPFGLSTHSPYEAMRNGIALARDVFDGNESPRYRRPEGAVCAPQVELWVGARGPRMNALASAVADGVFLSGIDAYQLPVVAGWARKERQIQVATYITTCPDLEFAFEILPGFLRSLSSGPAASLVAMGLELEDLAEASAQLDVGNPGPARKVMADNVRDALVAVGSPDHIAQLLVSAVRSTEATSAGLALVHRDILADVRVATEAIRQARLLL